MAKKHMSTRGEKAQLKEAVLALYSSGYNKAKIISNVELLSEMGPRTPERQRAEIERIYGIRLYLGSLWKSINQSTINRWLGDARRQDPDLEIRHILGRRNFHPGLYTNWQPTGPLHIGTYYDPITDTMHLGPGVSTELRSRRVIRNTCRSEDAKSEEEQWQKTRERQAYILAALKETFGYSYRDLERLSKKKHTRYPERDKLPGVKNFERNLDRVSYSKARRLVLEFELTRRKTVSEIDIQRIS